MDVRATQPARTKGGSAPMEALGALANLYYSGDGCAANLIRALLCAQVSRLLGLAGRPRMRAGRPYGNLGRSARDRHRAPAERCQPTAGRRVFRTRQLCRPPRTGAGKAAPHRGLPGAMHVEAASIKRADVA